MTIDIFINAVLLNSKKVYGIENGSIKKNWLFSNGSRPYIVAEKSLSIKWP